MKDRSMKTDRDSDFALDPDLHAYVDGKLSPERMAEIEARLAGDPALRSATDGWARHRDLIREAAGTADAGPEDLKTHLLEKELARRLQARRLRTLMTGPGLRQLAASVVIFAGGWGAHAFFSTDNARLGTVYPAYVGLATNAHMVYANAPERVVELGADDIEASLAWVSEQMERKIDSPRLERLGLEVIGARLIRGAEGPLAQFTYRDRSGEEITVTMAPHPANEPAHPLRLQTVAGEPVAYWTDGDLDYAVIAATEPGELLSLAAAVR